MIDWRLQELYLHFRTEELARRLQRPVPPTNPQVGPSLRERLAGALIRLGVWLDAEASLATARAREAVPGHSDA